MPNSQDDFENSKLIAFAERLRSKKPREADKGDGEVNK